MIWVWLKVESVGMFARESLRTFSCAETDALYAALNQEEFFNMPDCSRLQIRYSESTQNSVYAPPL